MEKLRDAKKIKWKESYTPKTEFLKKQFESVVGKGSYKRWEGNEVGGPGKWYVIVSPAGVHEHKRAKFFAGVRKLPDSYPAGGKYFDTIKEAYEYAFDTWGSPKPQDIPAFTAGDLKGISKRIDKWKSEHKEDHEEKEAEIPFDIFRIRTAMAQGFVEKIPFYFDIQRFIPILEGINMTDPKDSDKLYEGILALSRFKTRKAAEEELAHNEKVHADLTTKTTQKGRVLDWKRENYGLARPEYAHVTQTKSLSDDPGNFFDIAALICTIGRSKRESCAREFLEVTGKLKDSQEAQSIDRRFYRSNFEEAILSAWQKYKFNVENLDKCYDFSYYMYCLYLNKERQKQDSTPEDQKKKPMSFSEFKDRLKTDNDFAKTWEFSKKDYPIRMFVEYGRRDSASGYWIASPYTSQREWHKRITITEEAFSEDKFGLSAIDYAIVNGAGLKKPKKVTKEFADSAKAKLLELGSVPDQIKTFLQTGKVKGSGIQTKSILNHDFSPREFSFVIEQLEQLAPASSGIIKGLVEAFTGWVMFVKGIEQRLDPTFKQEIKAKANGCMYGGRKRVSDMASRESLVGLLQQEGGTLFSLQQAPVSSLLGSVTKLRGINEKNAGMIDDLVKKLNSLEASGKKTISFAEAMSLAESSGLKGILTKEDMMYLFGEALQSGSEISVYPEYSKDGSKRSIVNDLSKRLVGPTAQMINSNGLSRYVIDPALNRDNLSPRQKAILKYVESGGWNRIEESLSKLGYVFVRGNKKVTIDPKKLFVSRLLITNILRQQVETVDVDGKPVSVRVFTDEDIRSFLNSYKKRTAQSSFLDFKKDLEEGDITTSVFTNGDRLVMSRLTLTDYLYWKIMMNRFKHHYNLIEDNPQLYEDILRTFFVPNDEEIRSKVDGIGAVKFLLDGKEVTEDSKGSRLIYRGGIVRAIGKDGRTYVPEEKVETVFSSSPEENCEKIEEALRAYFGDKEKRKSYKLMHSFASRHLSTKLHHPQLAVAKSRGDGEKDLCSALQHLGVVQQKVIIEVARDMTANMDPAAPQNVVSAPGKMIQDPSYTGEGLSNSQIKLATSIRDALNMGDQLKCYKAIKTALKLFTQETGQSVPYVIKNYLRKYNQQITPSVVTAKISAALGYNVFLDTDESPAPGKVKKAKNITSNFDISKNASNAAIVLNSFFVQHCRRMSVCDDTPEVFFVSDEELAANEKKFMINSRHLAVCNYLKTTKDDPEKQMINVGRIEHTFEIASNSSALLRTAVRQAISRRKGTTPILYDPYIAADADGKSRMAWYNMAQEQGWKTRAVLITANVLTNWIHSKIPDGKGTKVTPEILSKILRCTDEEAEKILKATISSQQEFEALNNENVFDVYSMMTTQNSAEIIADMATSETEEKNIELSGQDDPNESDDAGADELLESGEPVQEANTSVSDVAPGVSPLVSDETPLNPPGQDLEALDDAAEKVKDGVSETAEEGETAKEEQQEDVSSDTITVEDTDFSANEDKDDKFKDTATGEFGTQQAPGVSIEESAAPVDKSKDNIPSFASSEEYDKWAVENGLHNQTLNAGDKVRAINPKSNDRHSFYVVDSISVSDDIKRPENPSGSKITLSNGAGVWEPKDLISEHGLPVKPTPILSDLPAVEETPLPNEEDDVTLPPPEAKDETYEVVSSPAKKVKPPKSVVIENKEVPAWMNVGKGKAEAPPTTASLLGLIRVAKTLVRRGEYKKADAINKFVRSRLVDSIQKSDARKLAFVTLSNLVSVSKSLQKEGKHDEANEINQVVKRHLERLG